MSWIPLTCGPGGVFLPFLPSWPHPGLSPPCLQMLSGPLVTFHFTECPDRKALKPRVFHFCPVLHSLGRNQRNGGVRFPFQVRLLFLRAVLLGWRGLRAGTILDLRGPTREVSQKRAQGSLGMGSIQLVPGGTQFSASGKDTEKLLKPESMSFPTRSEKIKSMLNPLLMKRRQDRWGRGGQEAWEEVFIHWTFSAYAIDLHYLHCPVVLQLPWEKLNWHKLLNKWWLVPSKSWWKGKAVSSISQFSVFPFSQLIFEILARVREKRQLAPIGICSDRSWLQGKTASHFPSWRDTRHPFYVLFCADFLLGHCLGLPTGVMLPFILFTKHLHITHSVPDHILGAL